jgi:ERCC4-type nuclease
MKILKDTREQHPWEFANAGGASLASLKTGDYTLEGLEDKVCIERKGCVEEFAGNLGRDWARFERELGRMEGFQHAFIICEFPFWHLKEYPYHSNNKKLQAMSRISGKFLVKRVSEIQVDRPVKIMFCDTPVEAEYLALSIFKRIYDKYGTKS